LISLTLISGTARAATGPFIAIAHPPKPTDADLRHGQAARTLVLKLLGNEASHRQKKASSGATVDEYKAPKWAAEDPAVRAALIASLKKSWPGARISIGAPSAPAEAAAKACGDEASKKFLAGFAGDLRGKGAAKDRAKHLSCLAEGKGVRLVPRMKRDAKKRILLDPKGFPILEGRLVAPAQSERAFADYEAEMKGFIDAKLARKIPRRQSRNFRRLRSATMKHINAGGVAVDGVADFQRLLGVEADGIVGADTAKAIGRFKAVYGKSSFAASSPGVAKSKPAGLSPEIAAALSEVKEKADAQEWRVPSPRAGRRNKPRRSRNAIHFLKSLNAAADAAAKTVGLPTRKPETPGRPTAVLDGSKIAVPKRRPTLPERVGKAIGDAVQPVGRFFKGLRKDIATSVPWAKGDVKTRGAHAGNGAMMLGAGIRLPKKGLGYKSTTNNNYGTGRAVRFVQYVGAYGHQAGLPELNVRDISKKGGGRFPKWYDKRSKRWRRAHASHRIGLDVDIRNPLKQVGWRKRGGKRVAVYDINVEQNWKLLRGILSYRYSGSKKSPVQFVFTSSANKRRLLAYAKKHDRSLYREAARVLNVESGHGRHFHVRLKKS
jgi:murein endopeptidase